ncbi:hypothetical protein [Oceanispirochaeta sp.]|jgi:predicted site-specific integrase-resolvase|uniref:hypothetical protein n=1 Tax=Oceanispirochaeta sp. TaxID=2035350 RepID=UPI0026248781|nr:hypothetical protein [Oceanispirochaeta sp.]MDA3957334.1 hypothetical protein [Oceanispirochaeta sp.]
MEITRKELQDLYQQNTTKYACDYLGVSIHTLLSYLKDAEIPLKGKGGGISKLGEKKVKVK